MSAYQTNRAALASVDLEIAANYLNSDAGSVDAPSRSPGEAGLNQALGALERAVQHLENRPDVPHTAEEEVALRELLRPSSSLPVLARPLTRTRARRSNVRRAKGPVGRLAPSADRAPRRHRRPD